MKSNKTNTLVFNPGSPKQHEELMNDYANYPEMILGEDVTGQLITISISKDRIITETLQHNNWVRINTYWRDGTVEETFRRENPNDKIVRLDAKWTDGSHDVSIKGTDK